ncbi:MAG: hypothetical protein ACKN81_14870 [Pirellulaceae bacterium]
MASYREGICYGDLGFENQMRTAGFIYQKLEVEVHRLQLFTEDQPDAALQNQWESVQALGEELLVIRGPEGHQVQLAVNQFRAAIRMMVELGRHEEALGWESRWKVAKRLP